MGPSLLACALLAQATNLGTLEPLQRSSPAGALAVAAADLQQLPDSTAYYTRYLALWTIPAAERDDFLRALTYWMNSLSYRRKIVRLTVLGGDVARLDLRELGWDKYSRQERLTAYGKLGVQITDAVADVWEAIAHRDPYFKVTALRCLHCNTSYNYGGNVYGCPTCHQLLTIKRGWLDPVQELAVRTRTGSVMCILRADWFLKQVGFDRPLGFYSDVLLLPRNEADLYKIMGADLNFIGQQYLQQGGAVLASEVALHNRGLELLPSLTGKDQRFIWRTYDTINNLKERSALRNFLGTLHLDGRELIGTLPNGLHYYYLVNAQGQQVGEVPTNIAQRKGHPYDATVFNAWTCVSCHQKGINSYEDVVLKLATSRDVGQAVITNSPERTVQIKARLDDYYSSAMHRTIAAHQQSYEEAIVGTTGMTGEANSRNFVSQVERYLHGTVNQARAALELGVVPGSERSALKHTGNPELLNLVAGETLSRDAFENAVADGMTIGRTYPWEIGK